MNPFQAVLEAIHLAKHGSPQPVPVPQQTRQRRQIRSETYEFTRSQTAMHRAWADLKADRKFLAGYAEGLEQALVLIFGGGHPLPPVRQQMTRQGPESA